MDHYFDMELFQTDMLKFGHRKHLAQKAGIQRSAIYQYLNKDFMPSIKTLLALCKAMETEPMKYFKLI